MTRDRGGVAPSSGDHQIARLEGDARAARAQAVGRRHGAFLGGLEAIDRALTPTKIRHGLENTQPMVPGVPAMGDREAGRRP